jgi:hypothetical protein
MKLEDYKNWNELISVDEFHKLLKELFENKDKYSKSVFFEIIEELSDKYTSFYGHTKLTKYEYENLHLTFVEFTDFSDFWMTHDLIGNMFNFRLDSYFLFLKNNASSIISEKVKKEVLDSLKEYSEIRSSWSSAPASSDISK